MFPHFSNPHLRAEAIKITSRAALNDDDDRGEGDSDTARSYRHQLVAVLEETFKKTFGDGYVDTGSSVLDTMPEPRKKRRKLDDGAAAADVPVAVDPVPFRLVSRFAPPKLVLTDQKPTSVLIIKEPPCEDTQLEAERRALQAREVAVDFDWVLAESKKSYRAVHDNIIHVTGKPFFTEPPALMITERPKNSAKESRILLSTPPSDILPSPHTPSNEVCCPRVDINAPTLGLAPVKKKRHRHSHTTRTRPPPTFWRPAAHIGGKSLGYAMGYEGSWLVAAGDPQRYTYQRDTMRKGVMWNDLSRWIK